MARITSGSCVAQARVLRSNPLVDVYSSCEPQELYHQRIQFCLTVHNEAVTAMAYPEDMVRPPNYLAPCVGMSYCFGPKSPTTVPAKPLAKAPADSRS